MEELLQDNIRAGKVDVEKLALEKIDLEKLDINIHTQSLRYWFIFS